MGDNEALKIKSICVEILRENARKRFPTKCHGCGKKYSQTLRWLLARKYRCPSCDGNLDDKALEKLVKLAMHNSLGTTKRPAKIAPKLIQPVAASKVASAVNYQLVLQIRGDSLSDLNATVALEEDLIDVLGNSADVDGHDIGSGETNIFIFSSDPRGTFRQAKPVLKRRKCLPVVTAAYRQMDGEQFTVIWPEGSPQKFVVT